MIHSTNTYMDYVYFSGYVFDDAVGNNLGMDSAMGVW